MSTILTPGVALVQI